MLLCILASLCFWVKIHKSASWVYRECGLFQFFSSCGNIEADRSVFVVSFLLAMFSILWTISNSGQQLFNHLDISREMLLRRPSRMSMSLNQVEIEEFLQLKEFLVSSRISQCSRLICNSSQVNGRLGRWPVIGEQEQHSVDLPLTHLLKLFRKVLRRQLEGMAFVWTVNAVFYGWPLVCVALTWMVNR